MNNIILEFKLTGDVEFDQNYICEIFKPTYEMFKNSLPSEVLIHHFTNVSHLNEAAYSVELRNSKVMCSLWEKDRSNYCEKISFPMCKFIEDNRVIVPRLMFSDTSISEVYEIMSDDSKRLDVYVIRDAVYDSKFQHGRYLCSLNYNDISRLHNEVKCERVKLRQTVNEKLFVKICEGDYNILSAKPEFISLLTSGYSFDCVTGKSKVSYKESEEDAWNKSSNDSRDVMYVTYDKDHDEFLCNLWTEVKC